MVCSSLLSRRDSVSRAGFRPLFLTLALVGGAAFAAAQAHGPSLVAGPIDEAQRVTLLGNTSPIVARARDLGEVPASEPAKRMLLLLKRSPDREAGLRAFIESLHDRNSASFHKWLTPKEFGTRWGASDADIAVVTAWLQSHGFSVSGPSAGRTSIEFSGTAGQVKEAFHTSIHAFRLGGVDREVHHANVADPQIPAALAPVVAGISALNDFRPKSMARKGPRGVYDLNAHTARPEYTQGSGSNEFLYVGPADAATIYNSPNKALNPAASGTTYDGTGAVIGIIGDSNISVGENANYRKLFGLAAKDLKVVIDGGTDPGENGDAVEAYLDTEVSNGVAPGAQVYFYIAADTTVDYGLDLAAVRAVNDNIADILNVSFGECEGALTTAGNQFYYSLWEQAAAQGISVTVSTGDSGAAGCDDPDTQTLAYYGLQVNGLASTPFNIAIGGTDFAALAGPDGGGANFKEYASETNDPKTLRSALGYIPEVPWNDSIQSYPPGPISSAVAVPDPNWNIAAGSGGISNCAVGSIDSSGNLACNSGYAKPSWQSAPGLPDDHGRDIPDVSLFAANGDYFAAWGICVDSASGGNDDCVPGADGLSAGQFYITGEGGTSASAPAFAGILALIRQATGERQGQADYVLYHLARSAVSGYHDIKTGNNSVPCQQGTPDCVLNSAQNYFLSGYNAGTGFDLASGIGSVDASALIANWSSAGLAPTTTSLSVAPASLQHGEIAQVSATVTSKGGEPTGDVALFAAANPPSLPLGAGIGTYPLASAGSTGELALNSLPGGTYQLEASYGGSAKFAGSVSAPVMLTITPESSTTAVSESAINPLNGVPAPSGQVPYGYFLDLIAQPYGNHSKVVDGKIEPDGTPTGTVIFKKGSSTIGNAPVALEGYAELTGSFPTPGAETVTASYSGDNSFNASSGSTKFTVTQGATQLSLSADTTKYAGKPITFTVALSTASSAAAPTGTITLVSGAETLAQTPLVGSAASGTTLASGSATITTSHLPYGTQPILATYSGDTNYAGSSSTPLLVQGKPGFSLTGFSLTLPAEHSTGSGSVVTQAKGTYSGTVLYTCVLTTTADTSTPPECAMDPGTETLTVGGTAYPQILIFGKGTKLPKGVSVGSNRLPGAIGLGSAALAFGLMLGIPARRRAWRAMVSILLLLIAVSSFSACSTTAKLITSGTYTFKVTGTDSQDPTNVQSALVQVRVL
jgi:hypothetical protein